MGGSLAEMTKANPYVYGDNNPVNEIDPTGKSATANGALAACILGAVGKALALFEPIITAGVTAILAGTALADIEVTLPTFAAIGAAIIVGCIISVALYALASNFPTN